MMQGFWQKQGRIFTNENNELGLYFASTHSTLPVIVENFKEGHQLYFSVRDSNHRSYTVCLDWDPINLAPKQDRKARVVLEPGELGCFDDSGAMLCCLLSYQGKQIGYYIGWNLGVTVPFRNSVGLVEKLPEKNRWVKRFKGPILDRTSTEPHFCASCEVCYEDGIWRMWYLNCTEWFVDADQKVTHRYHIKYAESKDGVKWNRNGVVAIDYLSDDEVALSRPSVLRDEFGWHMWYSYRNIGSTYRIGYAHSFDGVSWERDDHRAGLTVSDQGWDSEMVEYPCVFKLGSELFMLYNGNDYGRSGIGLAKWVSTI